MPLPYLAPFSGFSLSREEEVNPLTRRAGLQTLHGKGPRAEFNVHKNIFIKSDVIVTFSL